MAEPIVGRYPFVRVVVLNYDGGERVLRCLEHLEALAWPDDRIELVVVDNASSDDSVDRITSEHPRVRLIENPSNTGFPANNLAMGDLDGVDFVALCNDDAYVEPFWLAELVRALDGAPTIGAACPKILFADRYVALRVSSPAYYPGGGDPRCLGVQVRGVNVDGVDRWASVRPGEGVHDLEWGRDGSFRWMGSQSELWVPVPGGESPRSIELDVVAPVSGTVVLADGDTEVVHRIEPGEHRLALVSSAAGVDLINNAGSVVFTDGAGADRGFGEPDGAQYQVPCDVVAWCGGSVLLRSAYLADVGLFHEPFFLYYEDTDVSWRGAARGWRYRYVPTAVVRHDHSASSGVASARFFHFTERNRLLLLVRNAPGPLARRECIRYLRETLRSLDREVLGPLRRARRPWPVVTARRLRVLVSLAGLLPTELLRRRALRGRRRVSDAAVLARFVPPV